MTLYHFVQQLLLLNHDQCKKTLSKGFSILCLTLELTYYVFFFHQTFSKKKERKLSTTPQTSRCKLRWCAFCVLLKFLQNVLYSNATRVQPLY